VEPAQQQAPRRRALLRLHLARLPRDGDLFRTEKLGAVPPRCPSASPAPSTWPTRTSPTRPPLRVKNRDMEPTTRTTLDIDLNRVEGDLEFQVDLDGNAWWTPAASAPCSAASSSS
jgi:hypothetical protein